MNEVDIRFERENLAGIVAVGTYLSDAARRFGIELPGEQFDEKDFAVVKIIKGSELLSTTTKTESELLSESRREQGERLAEEVKIEKAGEIIVMSTEKKAEEKPTEEEQQEKYRKEFEELPLSKKIASLLELESITLSETLSFIINSPSKIVSMAMDVLAEMGLKMEDEAKKQSRPTDHQTADGEPSVKEEKNEATEPSVKEETDKSAEPSVKETKSKAANKPSVKEAKGAATEPSVKEESAETASGEESEPPPPSV
ncbi:MAG: hypothetical protein LH472_03010 [Pyrinomonadaceae bacterium]|nr:hypothetical protein [Pyrinomonadaceae bacterium]